MKTEDFIKELETRGYSYEYVNGCVVVNHKGYVYLDNLTSIPSGVKFENGGYVALNSLIKLPSDVTFKNGGYVDLDNLTTLPSGVKFENNDNVYLNSLIKLPSDVTFKNGGYVDLRNLASIPSDVKFENKGSVYLDNLTSLPIGVVFKNNGYVYLPNQCITPDSIKVVDNYGMLIHTKKQIGDTTIYNCSYLGKGGKYYVAEKEGLTAHGDTIKQAIEDVNFKIAQENFNVNDLINEIKSRKTLAINDYRLITGACRQGCDNFLESIGEERNEIPLKEALVLIKGQYGSDKVIELLN